MTEIIISKKDAIKAGLNRYFTGEPCNNGHVCERFISKTGGQYKVGCLQCRNDINRAYHRMPGGAERNREAATLSRRGVSLKNLPPPIKAGHCDLCERPKKKLHWDHDHAKAAQGIHPKACHRGWLCMSCNTALGKLGDNVAGLQRALAYLQKYS